MAETISKTPLKIPDAVIEITKAAVKGGEWVINQGLEEITHQVAIASSAQTLQLDPQILGRMHYAAELVTGGYKGLDQALVTMQQRLGKVTAIGDESLSKWLDKLGLKAEELSRMSPEEAFFKVGDSLGTLSSRSEQLAAVTALMGDKASTFLPLLDQAPWKVEQLYKEADTLGVARSSADIEQIKGVDNALERANLATKGYALDGFVTNSSTIQARGNNFAYITATEGLSEGGIESIVDLALDRFRGGAHPVHSFDKPQESVVRELKQVLDAEQEKYAWMEQVSKDVERNNPNLDKGANPMAPALAEMGKRVQAAQDNLETAQIGSRTEIDPSRQVATADAQLSVHGAGSDGLSANNVATANAALNGDCAVTAEPENPLASRLASVQDSLMSENEKLREHYDEQQFIIEDAFQAGLIKDEERRALTEELESQHKERLSEIEARSMSAQEKLWQQGWEGKAQVVSGVLGSLSQLMNSENKKQFEIGKKAAIAQAVIDTTLSAQKAFTSLAGIPVVGPALGAAAAAAAIAAGMARVNSIKSQSFGGGGGGAGGGASGGGAPSLPGGSTASGGDSTATGGTTSNKADAPAERQRVFVEFQGNEDSKMTARQWREFMRNLQEEAGDAQLEF